jgi:hypothetical protein
MLALSQKQKDGQFLYTVEALKKIFYEANILLPT